MIFSNGNASSAPGTSRSASGSTVEPIAIVGIGCRFPGQVRDAESFWRLLAEGTDAITDVPSDRWDWQAFYDADPKRPGKTYTRCGGFIEGVDQFEPTFFGISPREAAVMDPQQRLLLEMVWQALEDGGLVAESLAGSNTGVFIGISSHDYGDIQSAASERPTIDPYMCLGSALSIAANRISYIFDFRGPSLAIDTACSSSLVAVHYACQSLWLQETTLAIAGSAHLLLRPEMTIGFSKASMLSPDGRYKSFAAEGNGYVRSEGAAAIVLKPLSQALRDNDRLYALIRGSAVNQDGHTGGISVPSQEAQEAMLRAAYARAGIAPATVHYVEAHGTGTPWATPSRPAPLGMCSAPGGIPMTIVCWAPSSRISATWKLLRAWPGSSRLPWRYSGGGFRAICISSGRTRTLTSPGFVCVSRKLWKIGRPTALRAWPASIPSASAAPMRTSFCPRRRPAGTRAARPVERS
jgi:3-oxoacyl-(acyl-carrier-protein) synthase